MCLYFGRYLLEGGLEKYRFIGYLVRQGDENDTLN